MKEDRVIFAGDRVMYQDAEDSITFIDIKCIIGINLGFHRECCGVLIHERKDDINFRHFINFDSQEESKEFYKDLKSALADQLAALSFGWDSKQPRLRVGVPETTDLPMSWESPTQDPYASSLDDNSGDNEDV